MIDGTGGGSGRIKKAPPKPNYKNLKAAEARELLLARLKKAVKQLYVSEVRELLRLSDRELTDRLLRPPPF